MAVVAWFSALRMSALASWLSARTAALDELARPVAALCSSVWRVDVTRAVVRAGAPRVGVRLNGWVAIDVLSVVIAEPMASLKAASPAADGPDVLVAVCRRAATAA